MIETRKLIIIYVDGEITVILTVIHTYCMVKSNYIIVAQKTCLLGLQLVLIEEII